MLSVYLGKMEEAVYYPPIYFDNRYEDEWVMDKRSVEIIQDMEGEKLCRIFWLW